MPQCPPRPIRVLRREWKRYKPYLPKSTSLPILQLTPVDRPIFTCRQCGFVNTLIPLCLWCCWTSDAANIEFELSMPRARRASAPPRVFWQQNARADLTSRPWSSMTSSVAHVPLGITTVEAAETTQCEQPVDRSTKTRQVRNPDPGSVETGRKNRQSGYSTRHLNARYETRSETVTDVKSSGVATVTSLNSVPSLERRRITRRRSDQNTLYDWAVSGVSSFRQHPHSTLTPLVIPPSRYSVSTKGVDRPNPMNAIKTLSTKSLRSAHIVIDFTNLHEPYDLTKFDDVDTPSVEKPCPEPIHIPTQRTLRRKKRISPFRASSPPCPVSAPISSSPSVPLLQRPQSHSYTRPSQSPEYILSLPAPSTRTHSRSKSQPDNPVRLGHPSRPYYTAIRPDNMTRPTSFIEPVKPQLPPSPSPSRPLSLPARAPSPGIFSVLSSTSGFSIPEEEPAPRLSCSSTSSPVYDPRPFTFVGSMSRHRPGFSLSGEIELRMALARDQADAGEPPNDRYRYRERESRVMRKVNKLKQGFKDLVSGRIS